MKVNLKTRLCKCGYEFVTRNIKPPLNRVPKGFYGGNVDRICPDIACPDCGTAYDLWIKSTGQSWRVVTLSGTEPVEEEEQESTDAFDDMDKPALQDWLTQREVKYHTQAGEKKLRDLCRKVLAEVAAEESDLE